MGFSFFPKEVQFFDLFQEQFEKLNEAVTALCSIFQEFEDVENKCKSINLVEEMGNEVARRISKQLSTTFITPIDREDIHSINVAQEDLLNLIKAISTRIGLYDFHVIKFPAKKLVKNLSIMVEEVGRMMDRLRQRKPVEENAKKIKSLKYECEMLLLVALGEVYDIKLTGFDAVMDIVKWTHIYDRIEQAVNQADRLADIIEGVVLKNA
ncbi:MAG: phosphate transport regulator [Desulfovibrionaceae bacterium CG1_02_65_16]|nr:MAG: phosphate transport regulator [Desulfovibrionaceae bacterium CG1_02_65_16]